VHWYLAHDRGPLPHLFQVLWLFWSRLDLENQARPWVEQLLPADGTLDPQSRAELAWTAAMIAVDIGDDTAALAARQRLAPLLAGTSDPFLHAVSQLAVAWTLPITGDLDKALRGTEVALEELRGQDEPFFTAMAALSAGILETELGRYDDAQPRLDEARDLAEGSGGTWITAGSRMQLGIVDILRGRPDQARPLLDEALDLSLATRSTPFVTLCLSAYAWAGVRGRRPGTGGAAARRGRGSAPALRPASVAASTTGAGQTGGPGPSAARGGPVRSGVLRRLRAHPAGGGSHRPRSARARPGHRVRRRTWHLQNRSSARSAS